MKCRDSLQAQTPYQSRYSLPAVERNRFRSCSCIGWYWIVTLKQQGARSTAPKGKLNSIMAPKGMVQIRVERQNQRESQKPYTLCREGERRTTVETLFAPFLKSRGWHIDKGLEATTDLKSDMSLKPSSRHGESSCFPWGLLSFSIK